MTRTSQVVCVFGVVRSDDAEAMTQFDTIVHGPVAAVVGDAHPARPLGADDVRAHDQVVAAFVHAGVAILPMRFGSAVADRDSIVEHVLAPSADVFEQALVDMTGHVQYTIKVRYAEDDLLRSVIHSDAAVASARTAVRDPRRNTQRAKIELGRLVAAAIENRRPRDADIVRRALAPSARTVRCAVDDGPLGVADIACLVATARDAEFIDSAERVAEQHADLMRMKLLGPLAPYDFVPEL